jgi:hypothetical protein
MKMILVTYFDDRISGTSSPDDYILYIYGRMYLSYGNIKIDISGISIIFIYSIDY